MRESGEDTGQFDVDGGRLTWTGAGEQVSVEPWGANSVRVRGTVKSELQDHRWALLDPTPSDSHIRISGNIAELANGRIVVRMIAEEFDDWSIGTTDFRCRLMFLDADGKTLLEEVDTGGALEIEAREWRAHHGGTYRLTAAFAPSDGERIAGMGSYQHDLIDLKGATLELAHRNSQTSVPFMISNMGYGFLWHNPGIGKVTFGTTRTEWSAESTQQLDYWVTVGDSPAQLCSAYAAATGHPPTFPERALGLWQSKLRYSSQSELLEVAREYHRREIPLDVIVADFFHWPQMGDYRFEEEFWPDPDAMTTELRRLGVDLAVSVWPQVSLKSDNFRAFQKANALVRTDHGLDPQMAFQGASMFVDPTAEAGRNLLWSECKANYLDKGVTHFWLDEAEPEWGRYDFANYRYAAGPVLQVGNIYPQQLSRTFYEGAAEAGRRDIVNLVRSAWAGSQRYGALVWSGDIDCTWSAFRRQIVSSIHMGLAGIPWFTSDIGGFGGADATDPAFRELLLRWFQFSTFSPVLRMHGDRAGRRAITAADGSARLFSGGPNELWSYGDDAERIMVAHVELRQRMRPYLRSCMREAELNGQPVIRALFHEFPGDHHAWEISDQFLLGPDVLVAPIVAPETRERSVYLPDGADWIDVGSGTIYPGGDSVDLDAPLSRTPVLVRKNGSVEVDALRLARAD